MAEPVVASDGFTYERSALAVVLRAEQPESPLTREALRRDVSLPNLTLLKLIRDRYAHALRLAEAGVERGRAEARRLRACALRCHMHMYMLFASDIEAARLYPRS